MKDESKGAILVQNRKGETIKWFKTWRADRKDKDDIVKIEIRFKDKDGEKKTIVKEYEGWGGTIALCKCVEAVAKYWPKYDPSKHNMVISAGHGHSVEKKKKPN